MLVTGSLSRLKAPGEQDKLDASLRNHHAGND